MLGVSYPKRFVLWRVVPKAFRTPGVSYPGGDHYTNGCVVGLLPRSTVILRRCVAQVISSFVIFAVLDLRVGGCRP